MKVRLKKMNTSIGLISVFLGLSLMAASLIFNGHLRAEDVFITTAYCSCKKCCDKDTSDKWYGITATGARARWGTVAVDKKVVKLGSKLRIEGFPNTIFRAEDVGGAIKGKHIDVWFPRHEDAVKFGVQKKIVKVVRSG